MPRLAARVTAANAILDRGWGKATQPLEHGNDGALELIHRIERVIVDLKVQTARFLEGQRISATFACQLTLFLLCSSEELCLEIRFVAQREVIPAREMRGNE